MQGRVGNDTGCRHDGGPGKVAARPAGTGPGRRVIGRTRAVG